MKPIQSIVDVVMSPIAAVTSLFGGGQKSEAAAAPAPYVPPAQLPPAMPSPVSAPPATPSFYSSQIAAAGATARAYSSFGGTVKTGPQGDLSTPNKGLKSLLGQ